MSAVRGWVHACCLAHARRKYADAVKVNANDQEPTRIVALMDELFAIDREAGEQNMDRVERNLLRQQRAPKLLEQLRAAALAQYICMLQQILPSCERVCYRAEDTKVELR
jgi:predicted membrane chloride channel (bestrophin family)